MNGDWLIRLTIWVAVAAWLLRVYLECSDRTFFESERMSSRKDRAIRWAWLIGAVACVTHVICAMNFAHCWNIGNAMRHTAQVTRQVLGVELPSSVFVNFAFAALWLIDGVQTFRSSRPSRLGLPRQIIWGVMMLNGTVIFGPTYWMWLAVPCMLIWIGIRFHRT